MGGVGRKIEGGFEGTYGATRAEYEAALELEKAYQHKVKVPPKGGKYKDDAPDWAKAWEPRIGEDGKTFAKRIMDLKYGKGNYDPRTHEASKIKKWADTHFAKPKKARRKK